MLLTPHSARAQDITCNGGGVKVSDSLSKPGATAADKCIGSKTVNPIYDLLSRGISYATGVFGLIFVLMIIVSGLQYVISGADPESAKSAKKRITGAMTALAMLLFMFGAIQVILPPDVRIFH